MIKKVIHIVILFLILGSCRKAQEVDLILPSYDGKLMVECYLEPGQNFKMLLTESVSYLESTIAKPVKNALVTIKFRDKIVTLNYNDRFIDVKDSVKYFNYVNDEIQVPKDFEGVFELYITDEKGRVVNAFTKIAKPLILDSVYVTLTNNTRNLYAQIADDQREIRYYRFLIFQEQNQGVQTQSTIVDNQQNRQSPYIFNTSTQIIFKSKSDFFNTPTGITDSVALRAIEINKDYYDFLTSVYNAQNANGNPFAQPASIRSNITGGVGIFTGFSAVKATVKVP